MNLRLAPNSLRFKVDREELGRLLSGETLESSVPFGERNLGFLIVPTEAADSMKPSYTGDRVILKIAPLQLKMLADKGRSKEGLEEEVDGVTVSLQVDIRSKASV
ncbi:MAG TPA: hypothetical protein VLA17_01060 [Candidatus Limnocylindria bacterium]|nr:hypothetical protein [Candidatus Limnocylindria bacterium]